MAGSGHSDRESGFATPAAAAVSLAIALVATALTTAAASGLRHARGDLARASAEYALDGAQTRAALTLVESTSSSRLRWTPIDAAEALAEPEAAKLPLAEAAKLDDATLGRFGVADPSALRARLAGLGDAEAAAIAGADVAPLWRACAQSMISPYGAAAWPGPAVAPKSGGVQWRIGEVWRIRLVSKEGWSDDRIVRFTGNPTEPVAIIERRLARGKAEGDQCDALFASA